MTTSPCITKKIPCNDGNIFILAYIIPLILLIIAKTIRYAYSYHRGI